MKNYQAYVYIMTNKNNSVLYTGVTRNLIKRVYQHRGKLIEGFTKRYQVSKLIYYEIYEDIYKAIEREKQIKKGSRQKKIKLIESVNPTWIDLFDELEGELYK